MSGGLLGLEGLWLGLFMAWCMVLERRSVKSFPIFQVGLPSLRRASELSPTAYVFSALLVANVTGQFGFQYSLGKSLLEQIVLFIGVSAVFVCWELSHHLHQVLYAKRFVFSPPRGSAAAETNPSEPLLAALEESYPGSLTQCLVYLDLCMVSENNVDTWRQAAIFEESGKTYKRAIDLCLKPRKVYIDVGGMFGDARCKQNLPTIQTVTFCP